MRQRSPCRMAGILRRTGIRSAKPSTLWGHRLSNELEEEADVHSMRSYCCKNGTELYSYFPSNALATAIATGEYVMTRL